VIMSHTSHHISLGKFKKGSLMTIEHA